MAQNSPITIENQGFPSFRSDLNASLQALASNSLGTSAPSTTYAGQFWYDSTNNIQKQRNEDNDAWISLYTLDQASDVISAIGSVSLASIAKIDTAQTFTAAQRGSTNTDTTNSGSVTLDFATNQNFVLTLTGNVTLANPTTEAVGQSGFIVFIQDATGSRTLSLGTDYETAGGAGITLSTAANATDVVPYIVAASGRILLGTPQKAFS